MAKKKGKQYYDKRNNVKEYDLCQGDRVLISAPKENKLSPNFSTEEYKIIDKIRNTVIVQSEEGKTFKRNLTQVRKTVDLENEESGNEEVGVNNNGKERVRDERLETEVEGDKKEEVRRSKTTRALWRL